MDTVILEEDIDENYEPTDDEIDEYAKWLGKVVPGEVWTTSRQQSPLKDLEDSTDEDEQSCSGRPLFGRLFQGRTIGPLDSIRREHQGRKHKLNSMWQLRII